MGVRESLTFSAATDPAPSPPTSDRQAALSLSLICSSTPQEFSVSLHYSRCSLLRLEGIVADGKSSAHSGQSYNRVGEI